MCGLDNHLFDLIYNYPDIWCLDIQNFYIVNRISNLIRTNKIYLFLKKKCKSKIKDDIK